MISFRHHCLVDRGPVSHASNRPVACHNARPRVLRLSPLTAHLATTAAAAKRPLYDRHDESKELRRLLAEEPTKVLVVLGPRSAGKTEWLKAEMRAIYQDASTDEEPPGFLDGRMDHLRNPTLMAAMIRELFNRSLPPEPLRPWWRDILGTVLKLSPIRISKVKFTVFSQSLEASLDVPIVGSILTEIEGLLRRYKSANKDLKYPVFCIDEANVMSEWDKDKDQRANRDAVLRFMINSTKAMKNAHFILATSEYGFLSWIYNGLQESNVETLVLGEFPESDARNFFDQVLKDKKCNEQATVSDKDWELIYAVVGGNAGQLIAAAGEYVQAKQVGVSLERGLQAIWMRVQPAVARPLKYGLTLGEDVGGGTFTGAEYQTVVNALLDAEHNALDIKDVEAKLEAKGLNPDAVRVMVQANVLGYRPPCSLAKDIPFEPFEKAYYIITPMTSVHLFCMRQWREEEEAMRVKRAAEEA